MLVREDLSPVQRIVQACHAVAEFVYHQRDDIEAIDWIQSHKSIVIYGVPNQVELLEWLVEMQQMKIPVAEFREPYEKAGVQLGLTAIAVHPNVPGRFFGGLKLLSPE